MTLQEARVESIPNLLLGRFLGTCSLLALKRRLEEMPRRDALLMLRTLLLGMRQPIWMRREAVEALVLLGGEEAEAVLLEALWYAEAPSVELLRDIVAALQAFPSPQVQQTLQQLARNSPWEKVRREAVFSLAVLGCTDAAGALQHIARYDSDEDQRRRADIALKWLDFCAGRQKPLLDMLQKVPPATAEALLLFLKYPSDSRARSLLLMVRNHPGVEQSLRRRIDQRLYLSDNQLELSTTRD